MEESTRQKWKLNQIFFFFHTFDQIMELLGTEYCEEQKQNWIQRQGRLFTQDGSPIWGAKLWLLAWFGMAFFESDVLI